MLAARQRYPAAAQDNASRSILVQRTDGSISPWPWRCWISRPCGEAQMQVTRPEKSPALQIGIRRAASGWFHTIGRGIAALVALVLATYEPRHPSSRGLYQVGAEHLETDLACVSLASRARVAPWARAERRMSTAGYMGVFLKGLSRAKMKTCVWCSYPPVIAIWTHGVRSRHVACA
jgi:hypothetical protein